MNAAEIEKQLRRLLEKGPPRFEPLPPSAVPAGAPGSVSRGAPSGGQQITLEESDASQREYWAARTIRTSDGLLSIEIEPIKSRLLTSGQRDYYANPPADAPPP